MIEAPKGRCYVFRDNAAGHSLHDLSTISDVLEKDVELVWLDVVDPTPADIEVLKAEFALHPLAIEDATSSHERPKFEEYDNYWMIVVHGVSRSARELRIHEIAAFVGEHFVVTVRTAPAYPLGEIERRWRAKDRGVRHTSGTLLYYLLDEVVDGYSAVSQTFEERIDELESDLFDTKPSLDIFREIFKMKRDSLRFREAVMPMRDIIRSILRSERRQLSSDDVAYYRDVEDHTLHVLEQLDTSRELLTAAMDVHFSVTAQRQNEVSKQLTIIATVFLPLTYITGFFGQNFGYLVGKIDKEPSFWWLGVGSEVVAFLALVLWFRFKRWL